MKLNGANAYIKISWILVFCLSILIKSTFAIADTSRLVSIRLSGPDSEEITNRIGDTVVERRQDPADRHYSYERRILVVSENNFIIGCTKSFYDNEYFNDDCILNIRISNSATATIMWQEDKNQAISGEIENPTMLKLIQPLLDDKHEFTSYEWIDALDQPRLHVYCEAPPVNLGESVVLTSCGITIVPNLYKGDIQYEDESNIEN